MTTYQIFMLVFSILGGLALFIFGMKLMTEGLRKAAGDGLRNILAKATKTRLAGLALGTLAGFLIHSSGTTVMLVGFVNAGLIQLKQSIAPVFGSNLGTTLSMQAISFKIGAYCYVAITLGFLCNVLLPGTRGKQIGIALLGFGMLFLGMNTMSEAIKPYRAELQPLLAAVDGGNLKGMVIGMGLSLAVTLVIQSSGATIAMCFALIAAGVFSRLEQVYPIVLGAHLGTCITAQLASIGTSIDARRCAGAHLLFNILNVALAVALCPYIIQIVEKSSGDLLRQTANLHTFIMLAACILLLPFIRPMTWFLCKVVRSSEPEPEPSFLDNQLIHTPEKAIRAGIQELQRLMRLGSKSLSLNVDLILDGQRKKRRKIQRIENVIDEIKPAMVQFLKTLTKRELTRRQSIMVQHLARCISDVERIGDHLDHMSEVSIQRHKVEAALFGRELLDELFARHQGVQEILDRITESLDPDKEQFDSEAESILQLMRGYHEESAKTRELFNQRIAEYKVNPAAGLFYDSYLDIFDRIVRHARSIALTESKPTFWIKSYKLDREAGSDPNYPIP
jgi:phosphate:Na+ symporter